jgi:aminomethyltransferase
LPLKRTPLFSLHGELGGRLVEFGGWEMPVQYTGILDEHQAVRTAAGLFDISHMGEVLVSGPKAVDVLNRLLTNDTRKLAVGQSHYSLLCNDQGGVIDDLYVYRLETETFLLIINASRIDADVGWMTARWQLDPDYRAVKLLNVSGQYAALAVQGPAVTRFIDACCCQHPGRGRVVERPSQLKKNEVAEFLTPVGEAYVARTGYTGEDGFEWVIAADRVVGLWRSILAAGKAHGLKPAGLGARDTLRTEMGYSLYGHELDETTTPLEASLGVFVSFDKGAFIGREALAAQKAQGIRRKCVSFKMAERSPPPRPHYRILAGAEEPLPVGTVTSGTQSPSLGVGIGLGYVPPAFSKPGAPISIDIRGRHYAATVCPRPLYRKPV